MAPPKAYKMGVVHQQFLHPAVHVSLLGKKPPLEPTRLYGADHLETTTFVQNREKKNLSSVKKDIKKPFSRNAQFSKMNHSSTVYRRSLQHWRPLNHFDFLHSLWIFCPQNLYLYRTWKDKQAMIFWYFYLPSYSSKCSLCTETA